jgi:hypothetical protein
MAEVKRITRMEEVPPQDRRRLRKTNFVLGLLHLGQGIIILILGSGLTAPVAASFIGSPWRHTYEPRMLIATFLFLSAFGHLLLASPRVFPWYTLQLEQRMNPERWYEYALSASVMIVVIASLTGITDLAALISLFTATAAMNLFGLMMELHNRTKGETDWTSFRWGSVVGALPWVAIIIYFANADPSPPGFVYGIVASLVVLFALFPLNMWLQYAGKGPWRRYIFGEYGYMFLSLTAKSALAWQVFGGTMNLPSIYS